MKMNRIKFASAVFTAVFALSGMTAFAQSNAPAETPAETVIEDNRTLTPKGNAQLVDDISDNENLQFITVTARDGNVFYFVIDKGAQSENVYFLNTVDESDLEALVEQSDKKPTATAKPTTDDTEKDLTETDTKDNSDINGIELFVKQIPWNYYCLLTLVMIIVTSIINLDYGSMLKHEYNAQVKNDLFTTPERPFEGADDYEKPANGKSSVLDLLIPVVVLIIVCIIALVFSGGYFTPGEEAYQDFVVAFSNAEAGPALALGGMIALVFTFIYFWIRGAFTFEKSMESIPHGFIQMIAPILILTFAWTLCSFTRFAMYSAEFVRAAMANAGSLKLFLPAVIFIIGAAIGFATGTSWGTIGIMAPIVVAVFDYSAEPVLCTIGLAAACSGGVMGDHCSPISDTTIMASAGAHCFHLNHVFTQLPYAITVSAVAFVSFILAGLIQNVWLNLAIAIVLMVGTLFVIKAVVAKKHAGIFDEMAAANKALTESKQA